LIVDSYRSGVSSSPPTVEELTALRADNERLSAEREHYRELYLQMLEQCRKLELGLLSQKSERLGDNDAQLTMGVLATLLGERPAVNEVPATQPVREHGHRQLRVVGAPRPSDFCPSSPSSSWRHCRSIGRYSSR
jgi:hypothetical protein